MYHCLTTCHFPLFLFRWGRRWPLAIFHIVAGLALGVTLFIPHTLGIEVEPPSQSYLLYDVSIFSFEF